MSLSSSYPALVSSLLSNTPARMYVPITPSQKSFVAINFVVGFSIFSTFINNLLNPDSWLNSEHGSSEQLELVYYIFRVKKFWLII